MSIIRITPDNFEQTTLITHPKRTFYSSSTGVTGSLYVYARQTDIIKDIDSKLSLTGTFDDTSNIVTFSRDMPHHRLANNTDLSSGLQSYMTDVRNTPASLHRSYTLEVRRTSPPHNFASGTLLKSAVRKNLFPFYHSVYPSAHWNYVNYHCLNFFTGSSVPSDSVLMYPNYLSSSQNSLDSPNKADSLFVSGVYVISSAFSFEFYINPRYTTDQEGLEYRAGTIFHLSSTYALSLVTGSSRMIDGRPNGFRLLLQLSSSADVSPSSIDIATPNGDRVAPQHLAFTSADNVLKLNHWHHVVVKWGGPKINQGTGSFVVDGVIHTGSVFATPRTFGDCRSEALISANGPKNPAALCIGNFYQGDNSLTNRQSMFFNDTDARRFGIHRLDAGATAPGSFLFNHPLNAELHELRVFSVFRTTDDTVTGSVYGLSSDYITNKKSGLIFYLPVLFIKNGPLFQNISSVGGVLSTPFVYKSSIGRTGTPFNVELSYRVGGRLINIENFLFDFARKQFPLPLRYQAHVLNASASNESSANEYLYTSQPVRKRNLLLLPCDNGKFLPNFSLIAALSSSYVTSRPVSGSFLSTAVDDMGLLDLSAISLNSLIPKHELNMTMSLNNSAMSDKIAGPTPESPRLSIHGPNWSIYQRTRDDSSNEVTFFNVSNLYYGKRIFPKSIVLSDDSLTGSAGKVSLKLRDDGNGGLYRANAVTEHATWNSVGTVLYNEGIIVVKNPCVSSVGKDSYKLELVGEQNIYTMKFIVPAGAGMINSSSNASFAKLSASLNANEDDAGFVYITGINFHDDNLNVVMKTALAQPVLKRHSDKLLFRSRIDF